MGMMGGLMSSLGRRNIGEEPKPRVLFSWEGPMAEQVAGVLELKAPTVRVIDDLLGIRQDDYDVLVTNRLSNMLATLQTRFKGVEPHLFVVSVAPPHENASTSGDADLCGQRLNFYGIRWETGFRSRAVDLPDELLSAATDLVNDDLLPAVQSRDSHIYFAQSHPAMQSDLPPESYYGGASSAAPRTRRHLPEDAFVLHPFLRTAGANPQILAGWYKRGERSEGWVLPFDLRRPWDWIAVAIRHWAVTYRCFPLVGEWWEDPRWQTVAETRASETRTRLKQDLANITTRLQGEIAAAAAHLEHAQYEAARGRRRLLTDKGDSLKGATLEAFQRLGYRVIDRDQEQPHDVGGRIEDLGVADPDEEALDAIVEVKGYDRGAKAGDAAKMVRHMARARASGRSPSAIWWVINHWRTWPPAERGLVLAGEEALIAEEADEDVPLVLVDTVELFRALRLVDEGQLTREEVRASLRAAKGRWEIDRLPGEPATGDLA